MKKKLLTLFFAATAVASNAQDDNYQASDKVNIKWGTELKAARSSTLEDIIGYDDDAIYAVRSSGTLRYTVELESFDHNYSEVTASEYEMQYQGKELWRSFTVQVNDQIYIFARSEDRKAKKNTLYFHTLNKKTMKPNNDIKEIAEIDYSGFPKWNSGYFYFQLSPDNSKILIYYDIPNEKGEPEKFGFHAFDSEMNELWSNEFTLPYVDYLFIEQYFKVDNKGNAYILGKLNYEPSERVRHESNYTFRLLSFTDGGTETDEYEIDPESRFLTDMQIALTDDGHFICGGFYSDRGSSSIIGSYFLKIDLASKEITHESYKEFGMDFITQNMTEHEEKVTERREEKGKNVELFKYDLRQIITRPDGGAILVGEQYYVKIVKTTKTDANGIQTTTTRYHYYYNDIIAISIDPEGDIEWTQKIAKRQHTIDDGGFYSSYALAVVGDKLYFFFNDSPKNLTYTGSGKVQSMNLSHCIVTMVELDSDGNQSREALFPMKEAGVICRPKVSEQLSPDTMLLFGEKGRNQRFMEVEFKD